MARTGGNKNVKYKSHHGYCAKVKFPGKKRKVVQEIESPVPQETFSNEGNIRVKNHVRYAFCMVYYYNTYIHNTY